jgi:6-phosphogluconolactonase
VQQQGAEGRGCARAAYKEVDVTVRVLRRPVHPLWLLALLLAALFAALALAPGIAPARAGDERNWQNDDGWQDDGNSWWRDDDGPGHDSRRGEVGAAYSETNSTPNQLIVYDRFANGQLKESERVATGGSGGHRPEPGCPGACPILDTQGEVILAKNGKLVFAVNAGSNTISSFRDTGRGLKLVDVEGSNGSFPNSLTVHGNVLYVLNSESSTIAGFRFSPNGDIRPIPDSVRPLSAPSPDGLKPRQIGFDNTGRVLVVTLLVPSSIDTFLVDRHGRPGSATPHPSSKPLPFGFAFDPRNHLVMSQVTQDPALLLDGTTATYDVNTRTGNVTVIDEKTSAGVAPCWVVVTKDGRYSFVVNAGGGKPPSIARYSLAPSGMLTLLGTTPPNGPEFARTDESLSRDSRYLYVLNPGLFGPSKIDEYRVENNGNLTLIGNTTPTADPGQTGLIAR